MLNGGKLVDFVLPRQNHDAARMLARRAFHAHAHQRQAVHFGLGHLFAALFHVFFHVAVRRLVGHRTDGAGAEDVAFTEELLDVFGRCRAVYAGEVQIDIRHLVALEAEENLEGDIEPFAQAVLAADGAFFRRQVDAAGCQLVLDVEVAPFAFGAAVMRRQRVYLGNAAHRRDERRADRSARTDEVAVGVRFGNQLLRDGIQRCKTITDDGAKLLLEPRRDDFGQLVAVAAFRLAPAAVLNIVRRVCPEGLEGLFSLRVLGKQAYFAHLVGNLARVFNHDLARLFFAQIAEFFQHFVGRLEVQRRLIIRVGKALPGLQDGARLRVARVEKMHVARRDDGNAAFFAQPDDFAVQLAQLFVVPDAPLAHEELVVADGLDFEIIVKARDARKRLIVLAVQHGAEKFARLARAAEQQPVSIFLDEFSRHMRTARKVLQMAGRNEPVEVGDAVLAGRQQDNMVALADCAFGKAAVEFAQFGDAALLGEREHAGEAERRGFRIVYRTVRVFQAHAKMLAKRAKFEAFQLRIRAPGKGQRIEHRAVPFHPAALEFFLQKAVIERRVMRGEYAVADEVEQLRRKFGERGLAVYHLVGDAGQLGDFFRQRDARVDHQGKVVLHLSVAKAHRADFDNSILL